METLLFAPSRLTFRTDVEHGLPRTLTVEDKVVERAHMQLAFATTTEVKSNPGIVRVTVLEAVGEVSKETATRIAGKVDNGNRLTGELPTLIDNAVRRVTALLNQ